MVLTPQAPAMSAETFKFPFPPYPVQLQLMDAVYEALSAGKVGIFESPTGTGKSLSIICSSLRWLKENPVYVAAGEHDVSAENEDVPDWVLAHVNKRGEESKKAAELRERERLDRARKRLAENLLSHEYLRTNVLATNVLSESANQRRAKVARPSNVFAIGGGGKQAARSDGGSKADQEVLGLLPWETKGGRGDDALLLSDDDELDKGRRIKQAMKDLWSLSDDDDSAQRLRDEEEEMDVRKIIYCSRTHSQLSQFMGEIRRTEWGSGLKAVALASRRTMCINEKVLSLKTSTRVNAACLDLQRGKGEAAESDAPSVLRAQGSKVKSACPYLDDMKRLDLRDVVLAEVQDIEDIVAVGKRTLSCPYYGSRAAVKSAELVALPYTSLVHKKTRESLGVSLEGNVVIIDEAHNLIDAVNEVHSAVLAQSAVGALHKLFTAYLDKFRTRLSSKNVIYVQQVTLILRSFQTFMEKASSPGQGGCSSQGSGAVGGGSKGSGAAPNNSTKGGQTATGGEGAGAAHSSSIMSGQQKAAHRDTKGLSLGDVVEEGQAGAAAHVGSVMSVAEFCMDTKIDNINLWELLRYFEKSKILQKMHAYYERMQQESVGKGGEDGEGFADGQVSVVQPFEAFLRCLTEEEKDGRVTLLRDERTHKLKLSYQLLNAASHFEEIVSKAHAVVLVGGTMRPMGDFVQNLFPSMRADRVATLSVDHVISDSNILPLTLSEGPTGTVFDFRHETRGRDSIVDELGRTVLNICCAVPDGVVLFLPSYSYEELVYERWKATGMIDKIEAKKKIVREPRASGDVDAVLEEYAAHIQNNYPRAGDSSRGRTGSLLLSVVGGKLSEGINFSDGLGRCVMVAGLPFPNSADPALKEKIRYIQSLPPPPPIDGQQAIANVSGVAAGQAYYQNICMKAVNQCIGRAIRHVGDYAAIVLLDQRYAGAGVRSKIAGWISRRIKADASCKFGPSYQRLAEFFRGKRAQQDQVEERRRLAAETAPVSEPGCDGVGGGCAASCDVRKAAQAAEAKKATQPPPKKESPPTAKKNPTIRIQHL